ncbi:MAG TPA: ogr/Delta-like zinc finger family protein [Sphingomonas sp.]|jgi:DNA-directed RNA polymerase subunit RPC12/RpoP
MSKERARLPGIKCPHCHSKTIIRDSQQITDSVRELRIVCTDDDCAFSAVAQLSFIRQIRPSAKPNAEVRLPFGAWSPPKNPPRPANENHHEPANDDDSPHERAKLLGPALAATFVT